jgi:hypothetical protein
MGNTIKFNISFPTRNGFIGRECKSKDSNRYFKVHADSIKPDMFCSYCGNKFSNNDLLTDDQSKYAHAVAEEKAKEYVYGEIDKMFGDFARRVSGSKHIRIAYKPIDYRARNIRPSYTER